MRLVLILALCGLAAAQDLPQGPFTLDIQSPGLGALPCVAGRPAALKITVLDRFGKPAPLNGTTVIVRCTDPKSPLNGLHLPLTNGIGTIADAVQFFTAGEHRIDAATKDGSAKGSKTGIRVCELPKEAKLGIDPLPTRARAGSAFRVKGRSAPPHVEIRVTLSRGAALHPARVYSDANGAFEFVVLPPIFDCENGVIIGDSALEIDAFLDANNNGLSDVEPCVDCPPIPVTPPCPAELISIAHFELSVGCTAPPPPGPIDAAYVSMPRSREARLADALTFLEEKVILFINTGEWNGRFSMVVDRLRHLVKFLRDIPCAAAAAERLHCAAHILSQNPDVKEIRLNIQEGKKKPSVPAGFQGILSVRLIGKKGEILDPSLFHPCTVPRLAEVATVGPGRATLLGFASLDFDYECLDVGSVLLTTSLAFDSAGPIEAADGFITVLPFPMNALITIQQPNIVDLRLFRPKSSGSRRIEDADEVVPGGFTVANKNDRTPNKERDLVKIEIVRGRRDKGDLTVTLDIPAVTPPGHNAPGEADAVHRARMLNNMRLYADVQGKKPVGDGKLPKDFVIPGGKKSVAVFVEGVSESLAVRDMLIVARVDRAGAVTEDDIVALTFIWATIDADQVKHDPIAGGPVLWPDVTDPPSTPFAPIGNFGLRDRLVIGGTPTYANVIGMRATVLPPGIEKEADVKFDVTRDKAGRTWLLNAAGGVDAMVTFNFPSNDDLANDDSDAAPIVDQSIDPNANRHFFSIDAPRIFGDPVEEQILVIRSLHFREWIRVRVDGEYPRGNTDQGSRCSDKFDWHSRHLCHNRNVGGARRWVRIDMAGAATGLTETASGFDGLGNSIDAASIRLPAQISTTPGTFPLKVDKFRK